MAWLKFSNRVSIKQGLVRFRTSESIFVPPPPPFVLGNSIGVAGLDGYLRRVISTTPTESRIWTASAWVKRSYIESFHRAVVLGSSNSNYAIGFEGSVVSVYDSSDLELSTRVRAQDISDWYHIVTAVDTTQVVAEDRVKLYINGRAFVSPLRDSDYPVQDFVFINNSSGSHYIGNVSTSSDSGDFFGLVSDVTFVDGQALLPTAFGEDNIYYGWTPIEYTGTYGNNGYKLLFNTANLGEDSSGNNNDFTVGGSPVASADSPTSNYPTLSGELEPNAWERFPGSLKFENRTNSSFPDEEWLGSYLTTGLESGKWYFEVEFSNNADPEMYCGLAGSDGRFQYILDREHNTSQPTTSNPNGFKSVDEDKTYAIGRDDTLGYVYGSNGSTTSFVPSVDPGSIFMFAVDANSKKIWIGQNGTWIGGGNPGAGTGETFTYTGNYVVPFAQIYDNTVAQSFEFFIDDDRYNFPGSKPAGFTDLGETNLPISSAVDQSDYFDVLEWDGDGTASRTITGLSFTPEMIWLRNADEDFDLETGFLFWTSLTSGTFKIASRETAGNYFGNANGHIVGSVAGGLEIAVGTAGSDPDLNVNRIGDRYVALCFKQRENFFSMSVYEDNNAQPIGQVSTTHTLGEKPGWCVVRNLDADTDWASWHEYMPGGTGFVMNLDDDAFPIASSTYNSEPTDTTITFGDEGTDFGPGNGEGNEHLWFGFANNNDYVKAGYISGNSDNILYGPFVYTGFKPRAVIIKATNNEVPSFGDNWGISIDEGLDPDNTSVSDGYCMSLNLSRDGAATNSMQVELVSNGFILKNPDDFAAEFIWIAFAADQPNKSRAYFTRLDDYS